MAHLFIIQYGRTSHPLLVCWHKTNHPTKTIQNYTNTIVQSPKRSDPPTKQPVKSNLSNLGVRDEVAQGKQSPLCTRVFESCTFWSEIKPNELVLDSRQYNITIARVKRFHPKYSFEIKNFLHARTSHVPNGPRNQRRFFCKKIGKLAHWDRKM